MDISSGLFEHMVRQRNASRYCDPQIHGWTCPGCAVTAAVPGDGKIGIGRSGPDGSFSGVLKQLPVGGPYRITLAAGDDRLEVSDVLVGEVRMLAGQSNMQGYGNLTNTPEPNPLIRGYYMDGRWCRCTSWPVPMPKLAPLPGATRPAGYDLRKFRDKQLVNKPENARQYHFSVDGVRKIAAFFTFRDKVIKPLLANWGSLPNRRN